MTNFFAPDEKNSAPLMERISDASTGLTYTSETDAPIVPFFKAKGEGPMDASTLNDSQGVEEASFSEFFERLTTEQDWFGEAEKKTAKKFAELQQLLEEDLRDLKVLRVGRIQIDIYVTGTDSDGNTVGFQTKAVET
jgi:hypothetical protein